MSWYWVRFRGEKEWFLAKKDPRAAGGWTNEDTWEDFGGEVEKARRIYSIEEMRLLDVVFVGLVALVVVLLIFA